MKYKIVLLALLTGCYGTRDGADIEPPHAAETVTLSTAGAPAPVPVQCGLGGHEWGTCTACRSVHQCEGANRHFCCTDPVLDGERYSADCAGFCEPGTQPMVRNGVIACIVDLGQCGD